MVKVGSDQLNPAWARSLRTIAKGAFQVSIKLMSPTHEHNALTPDYIRDALRVCFDPELAVNIVDLGLIESIGIEPDNDAPGLDPRYRVHLTVLQRTNDEQRNAMLQGQIENRLMSMREISQTFIEMITNPPWTAGRMTPEARRQLGVDRAAAPALVQIRL